MTIEELCAKAAHLAAQTGIMLRWDAEGLEEVESEAEEIQAEVVGASDETYS